jgi:selenocysteine lyase/cysteine desulfurase
MDRRNFLVQSGLALAAAQLAGACTTKKAVSNSLSDWAGVRAQFPLNPNRIHMAQMFLASHPKPVADAIQMHREKFDADPVEYWEANFQTAEVIVRESAAKYMGVNQDEIALTDSTTMGLAMLYSGLKLKAGDEILTTTHDHYSTETALDLACSKTGAKVRRISLYDTPSAANSDEIASRLLHSITNATRIIAVTWVHSSTGVKLPIKRLSKIIADTNKSRPENKRIYFCVDGVHGFGVDDSSIADMGCDFFVAGTHKWIFGPRGTGVLYARKEAQSMLAPIIPSFSFDAYGVWAGWVPADTKISFPDLCSPGGFHSFEHRWAVADAFKFHTGIGKSRVAQRIHDLNSLAKAEMAKMPRVRMHTPLSPELSAGIIAFEVAGLTPDQVVRKLHDQRIIASVTPGFYEPNLARVAPSLLTTEADVARTVRAIAAL